MPSLPQVCGLDFVLNYFSNGCMCKANRCLVWVCDVNAPLVWNEVHLTSKYVCRPMKPLHVYYGISTLYMAPPHLFVVVLLFIVHSNNVVHSKDSLDDSCGGGLQLTLEEIVGYEHCAYSKLRWVANVAISGDVYLEFLMIVPKSIFKDGVTSFFHG